MATKWSQNFTAAKKAADNQVLSEKKNSKENKMHVNI